MSLPPHTPAKPLHSPTTRATNAQEARRSQTHVAQAREHLADAEGTIYPSTWSGSTLNYAEAVTALRDAQLGTGHALLAIHEELSALPAARMEASRQRGELWQQANRFIAALESHSHMVLGQRVDLVDVSNALIDVRTEVADVAAAVRELADAIRAQQQPRRRWFSRAKGGTQ
ncbi:hypothetical protein [Streptosporangium sp. NPDC048865]|uniref:hypothetical protein n=1 Tax=Streptosporangium sp. NPDC048865 TaxID=3155766 RepID=UPI003420AE7F